MGLPRLQCRIPPGSAAALRLASRPTTKRVWKELPDDVRLLAKPTTARQDTSTQEPAGGPHAMLGLTDGSRG